MVNPYFPECRALNIFLHKVLDFARFLVSAKRSWWCSPTLRKWISSWESAMDYFDLAYAGGILDNSRCCGTNLNSYFLAASSTSFIYCISRPLQFTFKSLKAFNSWSLLDSHATFLLGVRQTTNFVKFVRQWGLAPQLSDGQIIGFKLSLCLKLVSIYLHAGDGAVRDVGGMVFILLDRSNNLCNAISLKL